jgi:tyrosine-protein kinase Etk/Wzc
MNQIQAIEPQSPEQSDGEIDVLDFLIVVAKYKKRLVIVTLAAALVSVAVSFAIPNQYEATTKLLPPQQTQSSAAALLSQLGGIAGAAVAGVPGLKNPNDLYVGMLKSRTVADRLIATFNLKKVYGLESQESTRKRLESNTSISSGKDGLLTIAVDDKDQKLVAPLANAYVSELFGLMKTLAVTDASQRRLFYERQLAATKDNLSKAEMSLRRTMDANGVVSVDAESRSILETVARLKAQTSAKEIQLTAMSAFLTPNNPDYRRAEEELNSLRSELAKLENGRGAAAPSASKPGGLENIKLLRDFKYQQMLYEALAKQYEVARIDEAKDPSVIQVLDPAEEPERKIRPRRALIAILGTLAGLLGAVFFSFYTESRRKKNLAPEELARWDELKKYLSLSKKSQN